MIDGFLVLRARNEKKYFNKKFTAPTISSKMSFKYGRVEIRAALPLGEMLRPHIYLEPSDKSPVFGTEDELISIVSNTQHKFEHRYGIEFSNDQDMHRISTMSLKSDGLFQFNTYAIEWTEKEIRWFFDDNHLFTATHQKELNDNYYKVFDKNLKLVISLGVGGELYFPTQTIPDADSFYWHCPILILDYVRVYKQTNESITEEIRSASEQNKISSSEICTNIKALNINETPSDSPSVSLIAIISISSFVFLLALIPLNFYIFIRMKNRRIQNQSQEIDVNRGIEMYEQIPNELYSDCVQPNFYARPDKFKSTDDVYEKEDPYLDMTKKTKV